MNRSKASTDRNSKQRTTSRRPSASSLHKRQFQHQCPEKLPSTQNIAQDISSKMVNKAIDACLPKTRFNSQDKSKEMRSCSSPRLKYFPTEQIRKLDSCPPYSPKPMGALIAQQNPQEGGVLYVAGHPEHRYDNGQGDAMPIAQHMLQSQQQHGMQTASQQQVPAQPAIHQMGQGAQHSESAIPQQGPNLQTHRPFVPHDHASQKNLQGNFSSPSQVPAMSPAAVQQISNTDQEIVKAEDQIAGTDYEKQPVGGRNATLYRRAMIGKVPAQPQFQNPIDSAATNQANVNQQQMPNQPAMQNNVQMHRNPQNSQEVYQQLQQNLIQQQQMQQRAMNYQMQMMNNHGYGNRQVDKYFPVQGMTSPQDATVNQMKNSRAMTPVNCPTNRQIGWARSNSANEHPNGRGQLRFYSVDVINGNQSLYRGQNQQFMPQYQQQQQQFVPWYQQQIAQQPQQFYKNPMQGYGMAQRSQNIGPQVQAPFNQQMIPNQQSPPQQSDHSNTDSQATKKPPLKFTAGMVRDQEKLLATLKQQGIPMEIMMRQFEALLNEQRKHLEYLQHIRQQDATPECKKVASVSRKRKQQDEKPEWMIHLTPTRRSYLELEKLHEKRKKERESQRMQQTMQQQQQQQMANEGFGQQIPGQAASDQNYQMWQQARFQQQQRAPQQYSNVPDQQYTAPAIGNAMGPAKQLTYYQNVPQYQYIQQPTLQHQQVVQQPQQNQQYQQQQSYNSQQYQQQQSYNPQQYQQQQSYNPQQYQQQQSYNPQQYQQFYQPVAHQSQHYDNSPGHHRSFPIYEEKRPSTDPSSLLRMRLYKNEIRPQRRNNGLQDPEIARKQLGDFRLSVEARKGLEYLANLVPRKPAMKLNGMQDRTDVEAEFQHRFVTSSYQPPLKQVAANGLENSRNRNNPPPQRLAILNKEPEFLKEYPRQKQNDPRNCYSAQAERENGTVAVEQQQQYTNQIFDGTAVSNEKNSMMARGNVMPFRFDGNYPQHYQQMQQYYQNSKNFGGNIGEGDVVSAQRVEQNREVLDRPGGDANENINGGMNGPTMEGKIPIQRMYYSQPNIHEARTIGGVRYLARKQDYLPNQQIVSPETLIASRHLQPPIVC